MHIIDSYAWIEYFLGSKKAEPFCTLLLNPKNLFFTIECCLAEIKGWALREGKDFSELFSIIRANSRVIPITEQDWINAGQERFDQRTKQKDFGLIDAVLVVKQKEFNCIIISGDKHFKNLQNVIFLK